MRYLQLFEKFGINDNVESQSKIYFDEIIKNPRKKEFEFLYKNETGEYVFKVKIGFFDKEASGKCDLSIGTESKKISNIIIYLENRNDYSTFLHELKHLDYATRKPNFYKDIFHISKDRLSSLKSTNPLRISQEIFYLLDKNEFESRYHEYYVDFNDFISQNISKNPAPREIYDLFEKFLINYKDRSWTWYVNDDFKFEDYLSNSQINKLFHQFVYTKDFYKDEFDSFFKNLKSNIKKSFKSTFNKYKPEEMIEIKKSKKMIETKINKRLPVYKKKFFRLVTIMADKWCK